MSEHGDKFIGKTLGQFEIIEEIGRGGMATVYRARQRSVNRIVAVKILPPSLMHDPSFLERFIREVEVITQLEHPHILPIIDYGEAEGVPYIAMRYLGGGSFEQRLRRALPTPQELIRPMRQIAQALDHAHAQGVIHRDLKPGNIMLDESGNAYLSDFGIARVLGSQLTGSMIVGTPAYMSPEQANGLPLDGRSDIYALGVVLFEALTGRSPYEAETPMAMLLKHITEPMPPVRQFNPNISAEIEHVISRATAKDPDDRYVSATQMIDAFEAAVQGSRAESAPTTARSAPRPTTATPNKTEKLPDPTPEPLQQSQPRITAPLERTARRAVPLWLVGVIVLLVGGVALAVFLGLDRREDRIEDIREPTAFPRASVIDQPRYRITINDTWIPDTLFTDQTAAPFELLHVWRSPAQDAMVTLGIVPKNGQTFEAAVSDFDANTYQAAGYTFIDQATAPDGTLRRSYKMINQRDFPPAQVDVFYRDNGDSFGVLELITADSTGNSLVPTMQLILDSLRLKRRLPAQ